MSMPKMKYVYGFLTIGYIVAWCVLSLTVLYKPSPPHPDPTPPDPTIVYFFIFLMGPTALFAYFWGKAVSREESSRETASLIQEADAFKEENLFLTQIIDSEVFAQVRKENPQLKREVP